MRVRNTTSPLQDVNMFRVVFQQRAAGAKHQPWQADDVRDGRQAAMRMFPVIDGRKSRPVQRTVDRLPIAAVTRSGKSLWFGGLWLW